jgi:hypothetical protein
VRTALDCHCPPGDHVMRQNPELHWKWWQQSALIEQATPVPLQHTVVVALGVFNAQIRFVSFVQHWSFLEQASPNPRPRQRRHRRRRRRSAASASPDRAASPTSARVDAAAAPTADLSVVRRVVAAPTSRETESNRDPSTAASDSGDSLRRPCRRNAGRLTANSVRRKEARSSIVSRAHDPHGVIVRDDLGIYRYTAQMKSDASVVSRFMTVLSEARSPGSGRWPAQGRGQVRP